MVKTNPKINEGEFDSHQEINILQNEITELKQKLFSYEKESRTESLVNCLPDQNQDQNEFAERHEGHFRIIVEQFLSNKIEAVDMTLAEMRYCLEIMREMCRGKINLKDIENMNFELDSTVPKSSDRKYTSVVDKSTARSMEGRSELFIHIPQSIDRKYNDHALYDEHFKSISKKSQQNCRTEIEECQQKLKHAYEEAKLKAEVIETCQHNILALKSSMVEYQTNSLKSRIINELHRQQEVYRRTILELKNLEKKTDHLKFGLLQAEMKLKKFTSYDDGFQDKRVYDTSNLFNRDEIDYTVGSRRNEYTFSYPTTFGASRCQTQTDNPRCVHEKEPSSCLDSNLPERENECSKNLSIRRTLTEHRQKSGNSSYTFLHYLADGSCPMVNDQLGLPNEKRTKPQLDSVTYRVQECVKGPSQRNCNSSASQRQKSRMGHSYILQNTLPENSKAEKYEYRENLPSKEVNGSQSRREPPRLNFIEEKMDDHKKNLNFGYGAELLEENQRAYELSKKEESHEFEEFIKSVPLTGDKDVDDEILNFYRSKFKN